MTSTSFSLETHSWFGEDASETGVFPVPQVRLTEGHLHSVSMPAPELDAISFLERTGRDQRLYWAEPIRAGLLTDTLAGSGVAAELFTSPLLDTADDPVLNRFADIRQQAQSLFAGSIHHILVDSRHLEITRAGATHAARPRLFGGFAFSPEFVPDNTWSVFRPAHMILPHFQFAECNDERWLTINALLPLEESTEAAEAGLVEALIAAYELLSNPGTAPSNRSREKLDTGPTPAAHYPMSFATWEAVVNRATKAIEEGPLEKVVLSRVAEIRLDQPIDPLAILGCLDSDYASSFRFMFEPVRNHFFLGASPELLIRLDQGQFQTMALAGSAPRGQSSEEDQQLAVELQHSTKDRHEHQLVVDAIVARLKPVSGDLTYSEDPGLLALHNIQHLITPLSGRLNDPETLDVLSLVELLHPTPALGGLPVRQALRFLTETETVPRGWYAAPVGWIDAALDGSFAVAIRSAVCRHERAWLYAGAGIVRDSIPQREWNETELKFKPMLETIMPQERSNAQHS